MSAFFRLFYHFYKYYLHYNYLIRIQSLQMFFHQKVTSERSKTINHGNQGAKTSKMTKFMDLRELNPKNLIQQDIFSGNQAMSTKFKVSDTKKQTEKILSNKMLQYYIQNKKLNSKQTSRKQTENNKSFSGKTKIKTSENQSQRFNQLVGILKEKYLLSTKANSQESEKQNISVDYFNDVKNIIKICQSQSQIKQEISRKKQLSIEDFHILNFCGEGVFGSVYVARHKETNCIYALKKISKSILTDDRDRQCLIREMKIHCKLNHPNIVQFYGCFSSKQDIYFILQLCQAGNLYQMLQQHGAFDQRDIKKIIRQVLSALDYLHSRNIIHRDIKAQNIVIHEKMVKICDLGWASEGQYARKSLCGTPAYISPQVVQSKSYDKKVDIWSLGVLTFELAFGRNPFDIKSSQDLRKVVQEQLKFTHQKQISSNLKDFISNCLQKDSSKRWDTSMLLNHTFFQKD